MTRVHSLEEILRSADVVSIHTPLTDETRYMIDEAQFRAMKRTVCLINTARGPRKGTAGTCAVGIVQRAWPVG